MEPVFVYGSLMADVVVEAVVGRRFDSRPARLSDFRRGRLRDRSYPGIVAAPGSVVPGRLLEGVGEEDLAILDRFEDDLYERRLERVELGDGVAEQVARAFVWVPTEASRELVSDEPWELETFLRDDGDAFLASCRRFRKALR